MSELLLLLLNLSLREMMIWYHFKRQNLRFSMPM